MTIGIIIQARMGSTRLPGKVLMPIAGRSLLDHVLGRLDMLKTGARVVIATSTAPADEAIEAFSAARDVDCFRGSERDVLDRYAACARARSFAHIVRLTADNPFTDIEELDRLIALHLRDRNDYTHAFGQMPVGIGAEIFSNDALQASARDGHAPHHREHVNEYITDHPERFRIGRLVVPAAKVRPDLRLTVDTPQDYERACRIAGQAGTGWVTTEEAIALCSRFA